MALLAQSASAHGKIDPDLRALPLEVATVTSQMRLASSLSVAVEEEAAPVVVPPVQTVEEATTSQSPATVHTRAVATRATTSLVTAREAEMVKDEAQIGLETDPVTAEAGAAIKVALDEAADVAGATLAEATLMGDLLEDSSKPTRRRRCERSWKRPSQQDKEGHRGLCLVLCCIPHTNKAFLFTWYQEQSDVYFSLMTLRFILP
jgi:hypothetical protein